MTPKNLELSCFIGGYKRAAARSVDPIDIGKGHLLRSKDILTKMAPLTLDQMELEAASFWHYYKRSFPTERLSYVAGKRFWYSRNGFDGKNRRGFLSANSPFSEHEATYLHAASCLEGPRKLSLVDGLYVMDPPLNSTFLEWMAKIIPGTNYPCEVTCTEKVEGEYHQIKFTLRSYFVGMYCAIYIPGQQIPSQNGDHNNKTFVVKLKKDLVQAVKRGALVTIGSIRPVQMLPSLD
jgi:hypothetical protein